ncbi:MAG TPA: ABC transporter ATP-binding protein [Rectinemataceae bacterium]|nr:ABC transporter ATP-binding protein [Rectinemataceae bacterium]
MAFLELREVVKNFGRNTVVRGLSLSVEKGEFLSFLGGSGCGKTTTLRMIAGFETPSAGSINLDGRDLSRIPPNHRNLGMVFQNYALFPNMTVARNIAFGLKIAGQRGDAISKRVEEMLELIHMGEFAQRYPHQLSGGQQQRVALARALARKPAALLLDEPLSALDAKIRVRLRDDIRAIQQALGITTIYVTHDQEEALSISDRVAVMREGRIEQIGAPFEIYNSPGTPYVATFIGTLNVLSAIVKDAAKGLMLVEGQEIGAGKPIEAGTGGELRLSLRPEALSAGSAGPNLLRGRVENVKFLGSIVRSLVRVGTQLVSMDGFSDPRLAPPRVGEELTLSFAPEACMVAKPEAAPLAETVDDEESGEA